MKLAYYRLNKTFEGSTSLAAGDTTPVSGPTSVGTGRPTDDDTAKLSEIVSVLNDKFGTNFKPEDQLLFDQVVGDLKGDGDLADQARNNTLDNFKLAFDPKAVEAFVSRMERNEQVGGKFLSDEQLRAVALEMMMRQVFDHFQGQPPTP